MSSSSSRRMLRLFNCKPSLAASSSSSNSLIGCVTQPYAICGVKLTPERLVLLTEKHISIYVLQSLTLLRTLERHPKLPQQPRGLLAAAGTAAVAAVAAAAASAATHEPEILPQDSWAADTTAANGQAHAAAAAAEANEAVMAVGWSPEHSYLALPAGPQYVLMLLLLVLLLLLLLDLQGITSRQGELQRIGLAGARTREAVAVPAVPVIEAVAAVATVATVAPVTAVAVAAVAQLAEATGVDACMLKCIGLYREVLLPWSAFSVDAASAAPVVA